MEQHDVMRLALVLAVQAEIEGMKIHNEVGNLTIESPMYKDSDFKAKAEKLRDLAYAHNDQL